MYRLSAAEDAISAPIGIDKRTLSAFAAFFTVASLAIIAWAVLNENAGEGSPEGVSLDEGKLEEIEKMKKDGCPGCHGYNFEISKPFIPGAPFIPGIECLDCGYKINAG